MTKNNRLVIGKPYDIVVREDGRIMRISGSKLTKDDVDEFIASGIITNDDWVDDPFPFNVPKFCDVKKIVDAKFNGWNGFLKKLYSIYPTIAFSLMLKEYSTIMNSGLCPIHKGDVIFIVSSVDLSVQAFKVPENFTSDMINSVSYFRADILADRIAKDIVAGLNELAKPQN